MTGGRPDKPAKPPEPLVEKALAALIANTKRVRRKLTPLEVADWIDIAVQGLGDLQAVADRIDLSVEMLRQFASAKKLSPSVKKLVADRRIQSVDVLHRLSMLDPGEQLAVAREVAAGELNSDDVRAILSLRKSVPKAEIREIVDRVKASRNVKQYLAGFLLGLPTAKAKGLRRRFGQVVGEQNIVSLDAKAPLGLVVLNSKGMRRLQDAAKRHGLTKRKLVERIVKGEIG